MEWDNGGFNPATWLTTSTYDQPNTANTVTTDIATQSAAQNGGGNDQWTGWLQNLGTGLLSYAVKKDAVQSGLSTPAGQPVAYYQQPAAAGGLAINGSTLLLIGVGVVIWLAVKK